MDPYRAPQERPATTETRASNPPVFAIALLVLAALRIGVAIVSEERCGGELGLATAIIALSVPAMIAGRGR